MRDRPRMYVAPELGAACNACHGSPPSLDTSSGSGASHAVRPRLRWPTRRAVRHGSIDVGSRIWKRMECVGRRSRVQAPAVHEAVQPTERHAERGQRLQRGREPPGRGLKLRLGHKRVQHVDMRRPAADLPVVHEPERLDRRLTLDGGHPAQGRGVNLLGLGHCVRRGAGARRCRPRAPRYRVISYLRRYDLIQFAPQTTQRR